MIDNNYKVKSGMAPYVGKHQHSYIVQIWTGCKGNSIQIWTGYEGNSTKYMPEGVRVDNYFRRP